MVRQQAAQNVMNAPVAAPHRRMRREDRGALILETAIELVTEQGLGAFGVSALARRCGLTNAGLLHHFGSKDGLMIALLEERDRRDRKAVSGNLPALRGRTLTRDDVLEMLRAIVARNQTQPQLVRLNAMLRTDALIRGSVTQAYFNKREAEVRDIFTGVLGSIVEDAEGTARVLFATMKGLEAEWLRQDCEFDLVAAWNLASERLIP